MSDRKSPLHASGDGVAVNLDQRQDILPEDIQEASADEARKEERLPEDSTSRTSTECE